MRDIHALYHSALAQLERVCTCIIIRIRIYIRELAHARPPMSSISLVIIYCTLYILTNHDTCSMTIIDRLDAAALPENNREYLVK